MNAGHRLLLVNKKTNQLVMSMRLRPIQLMALLPYVIADANDPQMVEKRYELTDFALFVVGRES